MITPEQFFYLNATLVTVNGLFVGALSYRQYRLAQQKLKLDLYDRRFKYWEAVKALAVGVRTDPTSEAVVDFISFTWNAEFLFGQDVVKYLKDLSQKGLAVGRTASNYKALKSAGQIEREMVAKEEYHAALKEFEAVYGSSLKQFGPYLSFSNLKH